MKLLICTQAVDVGDSDLGFFVRWIEEFARRCEKVVVICLREGTHSLPHNVTIIPLGAEGRTQRAGEFISLAWTLRNDYDAVFVHMNPEYVIAAGLLWRLMHKRIALWYTHKAVNLRLRLASVIADMIFTASKESFRLRTDKLRVMGHGIDTDFFSPDPRTAREDWLLSVGRLMKSKRHDLAIRLAAREGRALRIAGEGPERVRLENLAHELHASVRFLGGLTQAQLRDEYRRAAYFIHTSETGSLDKVVLEALACGLPVRTNDPALKMLENEDPAYVREHHSLQRLIPALIDILRAPRVLFLFPTSREKMAARVRKGEEADTALRGLNHIPGARYATIGEYSKGTFAAFFLARAPRALQALFLVPRLLRYDFIVAQDDLLLGYIVSRCARVLGLKTRWLYLAMNSSVVMRRHAAHPMRRALLVSFWKSYFRIVCLSSEQADDFVRFGIPRERLALIPLGIDAQFFSLSGPEDEGSYVASVGRDAGRDYATLFQTAERIPHPFSVIAGRSNIPSGTRIPTNVSVRYDRSYVEVRDLYAHARLVVIASKDAGARDGSDCSGQTVVLDALAAGKAVIATRLPWIGDYFVPGEDLVVVEPNDPDALARAVEELWQDGTKRARLAASGRAKVFARYTTPRFAQSLLGLMSPPV
ncbi:MAG: glycosyltransferase [Patescibacteria group bacterium]|nr:glycosyltransferase [Patescibacteria group bacterium]